MITLDKLKKDLFSYVDAQEDSDKVEYFYTSANKALDYVHSNFPERYTAKYVVDGAPLENILANPPGETLIVFGTSPTFTADAKSYYFEVCGEGSFRVVSTGNVKVTEFNTAEFTPYRGFLQGVSSIEFFGEYQFSVRAIAMYDRLLSEEVDDIPQHSDMIEYDFLELTKIVNPDESISYPFCSFIETKFSESSIDGRIKPLTDYDIIPNRHGNIIRLKNSPSQKTIYYKRHFKEVTKDSTEIDIAPDLYYAFLEQLYAEYLIDESEVSVERAGYNYRTKVALKQGARNADNPVEYFVNERF